MRKLFLAVLAVIMLSSVTYAKDQNQAVAGGKQSAALTEDSEDKDAPLEITSDRMVSDNKSSKISFFGSVVATKGKLRVEANEMHIFSDQAQKELRELEAIGAVKILKGDKLATGDRAHYFALEKKIVLTGNPMLIQGKDKATGEKVVYYFDKEDMEIYGGKTARSTITLFPKENKQGAPTDKANGAKK